MSPPVERRLRLAELPSAWALSTSIEALELMLTEPAVACTSLSRISARPARA